MGSFARSFLGFAYSALAYSARGVGGVKPFRIMNKLRAGAWPTPPEPEEMWWIRDTWGCAMRLHPYYLIDHHIIAQGTYDAPLHRYIETNVREGMTVFDVGANIGSVALHISRRVGPSGQVVCFEPVPYILERLREHVGSNPFATNIQIEPLGVWKSSGSLEIDIPSVQLANHGCASFFRKAADSIRHHIRVTSLDDYVANRTIERLDLIKFDIQGAETAALQGAIKTVNRFRPTILTEVSAKDLQAHGMSAPDYLAQIEKLDYDCYAMRKDGSRGEIVGSKLVAESAHYANLVCLPRNKNSNGLS